MFGIHAFPHRLAAAAIALAAILAPLAGSAQDVPSYARPAYAGTDETIHGRIRSVDGAFNITVDDDRGFLDSVQLHPGTIINPTGLTLSEGMSVTILGVNSGSSLSANEIDTPYSYSGPLPSPVYYGPGYWCPGFGYGYGPSFNLAIIIGGGERPWYYEHRPFYGRPWDGRGYFGGYVGIAPEDRGRIENRRVFTNPALRSETGVRTGARPVERPDVRMPAAHVPPAFAGRSFAGDAASGGQRFSTDSNRPTSTRTVPNDTRSGYRQQWQNRGPEPTGTSSRAVAPSRAAEPARGSAPSAVYGGARSTGSGAAPHAPAAHAGGGGGHPH